LNKRALLLFFYSFIKAEKKFSSFQRKKLLLQKERAICTAWAATPGGFFYFAFCLSKMQNKMRALFAKAKCKTGGAAPDPGAAE
jgi:hypothetical protein